MRLSILTLLVAFAFAGCSTWHNPNIADPAEADKILAKDKAYCEKWSEGMVPMQPSNEPVPVMRDDFLDGVQLDEGQFEEGQRQDRSFDACMKRKGWVKK